MDSKSINIINKLYYEIKLLKKINIENQKKYLNLKNSVYDLYSEINNLKNILIKNNENNIDEMETRLNCFFDDDILEE